MLRKQHNEVLRLFAAGASGLHLRWYGLLASPLAMLPLGALFAVVLGATPALTALSIGIGAAAALVHALGLARWPFAVPELARRHPAAEGQDADTVRGNIELTFATLNRLLGV